MTADWDARTYDRVADPQTRWGATVLDRLPLRGDERVLDAGCGSGRVTELLLERLPDGQVVALDGSAAMIDEARRRLATAEAAGRVTFVTADLLDPLPIDPPVDAILSTATFHWITDHDALFRNLAAVIRPGGRFVAQCGGAGNVATVLAAAEVGAGLRALRGPVALRDARRRPPTGCRRPASSRSRRGSTPNRRRSRRARSWRHSSRPSSSASTSPGCPQGTADGTSTRWRGACRDRRSTTSASTSSPLEGRDLSPAA